MIKFTMPKTKNKPTDEISWLIIFKLRILLYCISFQITISDLQQPEPYQLRCLRTLRSS